MSSFLFSSKYFPILCVILSLIHGLLRSILFSFNYLGYFPGVLQLLISNSITARKHTLQIKSFWDLWQMVWLVKYCYALEKNVYSATVGWNILWMSMVSDSLTVLFKSLLLCCLPVLLMGFSGRTVVKNLPANAEDSDPWVGKIPWSKNGNPFQYSCLENAMGREA